MRFVLSSIVGLLLVINSAGASEWLLRSEESHLGFVGTQNGSEFEGSFGEFEADIVFDPDELEAASVEVVVDISSFYWADEEHHTLAMSPDWFAQSDHPTAIFQSNSFRHVEGSSYEAEGTLSLKGVTLAYTLPFELFIEGDMAHMVSFSEILRHDFGVGSGEVDGWFGNEVALSISIVADRN